MEMEVGYEDVEEGCSTPTREEYRIRVGTAPPPPPPRKKPVALLGKKRAPPKKGYFQAPADLDVLFAVNPIRRQACA